MYAWTYRLLNSRSWPRALAGAAGLLSIFGGFGSAFYVVTCDAQSASELRIVRVQALFDEVAALVGVVVGDGGPGRHA